MHAQLRAYSKFHIRLTYFYCISKQDDLKWSSQQSSFGHHLLLLLERLPISLWNRTKLRHIDIFFPFCMLTPASVKALATFSKKKNLE